MVMEEEEESREREGKKNEKTLNIDKEEDMEGEWWRVMKLKINRQGEENTNVHEKKKR